MNQPSLSSFIWEDDDILAKPGIVRTIYDPTAGTGGMLSVAGEYLEEHNPQARLTMFGQELNPESYAICKADMLIKGQEVANIVFGNTFSDDGHPHRKFDYMLSNPPFGVEWLGEVPEHWEVKRIKHVVISLEQGWSPQCEGFPVESPQEWGILKVGCVNGGTFKPEENKTLPLELQPLPNLGVLSNDLLISRANTRELVGSAAVVFQDYPKLLLCDKLYRIRSNHQACLPIFLAFCLSTRKVRGQIELEATGASSSMLNIGQSTILELVVALPAPKEQQTIADYLDLETAKIDTLTTEAQTAITLLQER